MLRLSVGDDSGICPLMLAHFIIALFFFLTTSDLIFMCYLIKSALGIDLFEGVHLWISQ